MRWLDLWSNQLTGAIPPELGNLSDLNYLSVGSNLLRGTIPPELGNLIDLTHHRLWSNQFSGSIPTELGNLTNLIALNLRSNKLTGEVPASLANLVNLGDASGLDIRWNGLYTHDAGLHGFLNDKQTGGPWHWTQTVPPFGLAAGSPAPTSLALSWMA